MTWCEKILNWIKDRENKPLLFLFSFVVLLLMTVFTLCYLLGGMDFSLLGVKLKSMLLLRRFLFFRLLGWEVPFILLLGVLSGDYTLHMMDPSGSSGSTHSEGGGGSDQPNFWDNFDIEVLLEPFSGTSGTGSVNQPAEGMPVPPANPVGEQAGPENPEVPEDPSEILGGDSIESIKSRLLQSKENPSPEEIRIAEYDAEDLFQVKVEIIRGMTPLDPEGDWPGRGARALDNPRTSTGEDSLENLYRLKDGVLSGDAEIISKLKDRMVFRRADNDAASQN
uniref:DUF8018 domain-containing protein n=1 Tax=Sophora flavescens TaxID=49840 RepID=A0A4Y5UYY4_SOPFL|nr:hypothetical protein FPI08_mgp21 [Sophora flavescens]QDD68276.1 hypothetical protein [Sophora flavescens]